MSEAERRAYHGSSRRSHAEPRALSTASRLGGAALANSREGLRRHERSVTAVAASAALGIGVVGARYPKALAWPLSALLGLAGATGLLHAFRPDRNTPPQRRPDSHSGEDR